MSSIIWNPPSKYSCPCYPYTQQMMDWYRGPQAGLTGNEGVVEYLRPKTNIPAPTQPICRSCYQLLADAHNQCPSKDVKQPPEQRVGKFLGKRKEPEEEEVDSPTCVTKIDFIEVLGYVDCYGNNMVACELASLSKIKYKHGTHESSPKRRKSDNPSISSDVVTCSMSGTESPPSSPPPRASRPRKSPDRQRAKQRSDYRRWRMLRLHQDKSPKCANHRDEMEYYHTGRSPPIQNTALPIPPSTPCNMAVAPTPQNDVSTPCPLPKATSIPLSPVYAGEEIAMQEAPATKAKIKLNVNPQSDVPTKAAKATAQSSSGPIPSTPTSGAGYSTSAKACQPKKQSQTQTAKPSTPTSGAGYSSSSKACQPKNQTQSQVTKPSRPTTGAGYSASSKACQPRQPKKQTPLPAVTLLLAETNTTESSSASETSQRSPSGLIFQIPPRKPYVEDDDEEL